MTTQRQGTGQKLSFARRSGAKGVRSNNLGIIDEGNARAAQTKTATGQRLLMRGSNDFSGLVLSKAIDGTKSVVNSGTTRAKVSYNTAQPPSTSGQAGRTK